MRRYISSLLITLLAVGLISCKDRALSAPQTSPIPAVKQPKVPESPAPEAVNGEEPQKAEYQVIGVRDPFQPFAGINPAESMAGGYPGKGPDPLQKLALSQVYLVGVIIGKQNKALLQDTSGMGYIVSEGMLIGENNGVITKITKDAVTVKQHFKDYMGRVTTREVVLALRKEEGVK